MNVISNNMFDIAWLSEAGGRAENQDCVCVSAFERTVFAAVFDGVGGHSGGAEASQLASDLFRDSASRDHANGRTALQEMFLRANSSLRREQKRTNRDMMTTAAALLIENGELSICHAGDSRCYWFQEKRIKSITRDHSAAQLALMCGEISFDGIRTHPDRNKIFRALGANDEISTDSSCGIVKPGDAFLLCSDGFWTFLLEDEMQTALRESTDAAAWLKAMERKLASGLPVNADNYSAITIIMK